MPRGATAPLAAVPHLDGLQAVALTRQPALPVDYLSDPRIHFVALAQLQRFVAAKLRERSIPGEESRLRREARTLWSAVAFAEQLGIDLEPLLATIGPPAPPEGWPTGRPGSRGAIMLATSPRAAAGPSPSGSAGGPVHPPEEPAGHGPLVVAATLLASSFEQRQRRAAERGQAARYEYPYRPRRDAPGATAQTREAEAAERLRLVRLEAEEELRWEIARATGGTQAETNTVEARAEAAAAVSEEAWVVPEMYTRDSAEAIEHARRKVRTQRRRAQLEKQARKAEALAAARRAEEQAELDRLRLLRLEQNLSWEDELQPEPPPGRRRSRRGGSNSTAGRAAACTAGRR